MERPSNRLAGETSPYLQQHARNPVDWYPWGEEALARARSEDRPIFLSVGYSACHWCHVMERESFEDEEIARFMNDHFVNVKVDREERPDIDATYMSAVQMLTGSGGWPMSVFLTPELKPFWGGTYFPPRARWGRPGFLDVLREIARVCGEDRARVEQTARDITERLSQMERLPAADELGGTALIDAFVQQSIRSFDARWGGFGSAPKFPRSVDLSLLLCVHRRTGSAEVLEICEKTLEGMALGGMYDQIGGGFHRYSTDARWLVPHFEKMLYDNALLARTYVEAWQVSGKPLYRRIACEVLDYVLREMTSPEGGFYSATDADSEGEEGKFFVWTPAEVEAVVGAEGARRICAYYDITERGNFENETSIPHCPRALDEVARSLAVDRDELEKSLAGLRLELREAREAREKPFRDEKVITAWNALMVSAFAVAYQVFRDERYLEAARRAERFLRERLLVGEQLQRTYKDGRARHDAFLDDHAYLIAALLDLYEATFEAGYLIAARDLAAHVVRHFHDADNGGFFFSATYHEELAGRRKELMDGATPSSNGVAARSFARLERLVGSGTYQRHAEEALRAAGRLMEQVPAGFAASLLALDHLLHPPVEIAVVGSPDEAMLRAIHEPFVPARVVAGRIPSAGDDGAPTVDVPFLADKAEPATGVAVWVCKDLACSPPSSDPAEVRRLLA